MFRRRRPLLRGAAVAGAGYAIGKHVQGGRDEEAAEAAEPAAPEAPAADAAMSPAALDELRQLADLKKEGVLTEAEFEAQKQKLLQGG